MTDSSAQRRAVYVVMSARSMPYARACLGSLLRNALEPLDVTILTDSDADVASIRAALDEIVLGGHSVRVPEASVAEAAPSEYYRHYPKISEFRRGHPCWRKVTDPQAFAGVGDDVIVIDPDVYFPNAFAFEPPQPAGILLMQQRPNCLLPEPLVREYFAVGIPLADHTDIGVCQFTAPLDLAYLEWLLGQVPVMAYARSMHVESIIWAALAMKSGGGFLDPTAYHCYANTPLTRVARKLGDDGVAQVRRLDLSGAKAFHAGGIAKHWLQAAEDAGMFNQPARLAHSTPTTPYRAFTSSKFERKFAIRRWAERVGAYKLLGAN